MPSGFKINSSCFITIFHERLRVSVNQRKPTALHLNHDPVSFLEGVQHILELERYVRNLIGDKGLRFLERVTEPPTHNIGPDQLLIIGQLRFGIGQVWVIRLVGWVHIN